MNWSLQLITLLTCTMLGWSGEAPLPLPAPAQKHIDTLNTEIAKAEEEKNQKVTRAVDKAIKSLNALVKEAKTAQERRAIDDEILRLEKLKGDPAGDLLGEKRNPWVGRYKWWGGKPLQVKDDLTVVGDITVQAKVVDGRLVIDWGSVIDYVGPPDADGNVQVETNKGTKHTYTKLKE